ncbi:MAG TPA: hypothetical protein VG345_15205 [Bryobacteraceae bacterium]|nr:hypothetical protein [Bryobacteraceae bacterium]
MILNLWDVLPGDKSARGSLPIRRGIGEAADRAVALDRPLLPFGRRHTGRRELVNLNTVLSEMGQLIGTVPGDRYAIRSRVNPELRPVEASPAQIERTILNLLMNARRPAPARGTIALETANVNIDREFSQRHPAVEPGEYVSISVTDSAQTGPAGATGDPFRADPGQYSKLPGARDAIRELGAQVWAFSELGVGSTIRVFFRPAAAVESSGAGATVQTSGSETILIIDGDEEVRAATARGLKANGYRVLQAQMAEEARRIAAAEKEIHLAITEVDSQREKCAGSVPGAG